MAGESANQALRQIRTLYALGPVGGLSDGELIERFLGHDGADREDAFAALVRRHGPMVLKVCRRMLTGSADADDAFQAVFLILARKAGAIRRTEALKSWLYGVAVRTAKEARRRSARRRAREGGAMDDSRAVAAPDEGRDDLLALLDEEIDRLPSHYRDPLLLCELEGISRQEAARQLGLPEGTLSSRLARGRALLRDRLARRGVTLGAGLAAALFAESAVAALPEPLADSTVQLALTFAAGGTAAGSVPTAVASLAEGVIRMISVAKLKSTLVATVALVAAVGLTAGLARAVGPQRGAQAAQDKPSRPASAVNHAAADKPSSPRQVEVRGVVLDEAGRPVAGAEVRAEAFTVIEARGVSGADGSFAFPIRSPHLDGTVLLARSAEGDHLGVFRYGLNLTEAAARTPARIVLKPGRPVIVRVADSDKAPVSGAAVEVVSNYVAGNFSIFDHAATGPDGSARLVAPGEEKVQCILALKPGRGFDYAEFLATDERGLLRGGVPAAELPGSVALTFDSVWKTARIKAVGRDGKPVAGVGFRPSLLRKEGRRSEVNLSSRILTATTGPDGVAIFDWLPRTNDLLQFWPIGEGYVHRRINVKDGQIEPVTAKLTRTEAIRGRVARPDGSPAPGIKVRAVGSGRGMARGQDWSRTAADGSYELEVNPSEAYAVFVEDKDWAAPSRLDVIVREGKPGDGIDFKLTRGTILRGTVTVESDNQPVSYLRILLDEVGDPAPEEFREEGNRFAVAREASRQVGTTTDAAGRYSIRIGPGTYTLISPPQMRTETITVKDEPELVRDFRMRPRPEVGALLTGRVVVAGAADRGVAGAKLKIAVANLYTTTLTVTADDEGRFRAERHPDRLVICAKSPDGTLGAIVEVDAQDREVVVTVAPTATATGRLLDEDGKPAANQKLEWGRRVFLDGERRVSALCFAPRVVTDSEGRFTLPSLVVGQEYEIALLRDGTYHAAGAVKPEKPGPIDLGTLRAGTHRP
jgi:RNA polymerase sigma factor (sigma-70 family)